MILSFVIHHPKTKASILTVQGALKSLLSELGLKNLPAMKKEVSLLRTLSPESEIPLEEIPQTKLLPIRNTLVDSFLEDWGKTLETEERGTKGGKVFENKTHYHSTRLLTERKDFKAKTYWEKQRAKETEERLQRYVNTIAPLQKPKIIEKQPEEKRTKTGIEIVISKSLEKISEQAMASFKSLDTLPSKGPVLETIKTELELLKERMFKLHELFRIAKKRTNWEPAQVEPLLKFKEILEFTVLKLLTFRALQFGKELKEIKSDSDEYEERCWKVFEAATIAFQLLCRQHSKDYIDFFNLDIKKSSTQKTVSVKKETKLPRPPYEVFDWVAQSVINVLCDAGFKTFAEKVLAEYQKIVKLQEVKEKKKKEAKSSTPQEPLRTNVIVPINASSPIDLPFVHLQFKYRNPDDLLPIMFQLHLILLLLHNTKSY